MNATAPSPCPDQADCYGEIVDRTPEPFHLLGVRVGARYRLGPALVTVVGFHNEFTALVAGGLGAAVKVPLESFVCARP